MTKDKLINDYVALLKNTKSLSDQEIMDWSSDRIFSEHQFYIELIQYLSPVFPHVKQTELEQFALICFTFLRGLIGFDRLMDNHDHSKFKLGLINYELAVKLTTDIYPKNHLFWQDYSRIQANFFDAIHCEKAINVQQGFDQAAFEQLSQNKSAYVKLAVCLLSHAEGDFSHVQTLNDSLMSLHVALQYIDDIKDFKQDIQNQQVSYIYCQTAEFLDELGIELSETPADTLYKYMQLSGLAVEHYKAAVSKLEQALALVSALSLTQYQAFLSKELRQTEKLMWATRIAIENNQFMLKKRPLRQPRPLNDIVGINSIVEANNLAIDFVLQQLNENGLWESFLTDNGRGSYWVSAFVACHLLEAGVTPQQFNLTIERLVNVPKERFSYNIHTPKDGDSSTFFIHFHQLCQRPLSSEKLDSWLDFADESGGWRTYHDSAISPMMGNQTLECDGWTSTHVCVTAAAAYVLATSFDNPVLENTLDHLVKVQQCGGHWQSYWWSSDIYATSFAVQALSKSNSSNSGNVEKNDRIHRACDWLAAKQNDSGDWGDAFYTALAVKALLCVGQRWQTEIEYGINWLLNNQLTDGSWLTTNVLRVPQPDVRAPEKISRWRKSPFGYNTLTIDDQRTFTTSLIVSTLHQFWQQKKETSC